MSAARTTRMISRSVTVVVFAFLGAAAATPSQEAPVTVAPTEAERLIVAHGCQATPDGPPPTRAVVTLPGQSARYVRASVGFDIWLGRDGKAATGDERPGTLHAFCPGVAA